MGSLKDEFKGFYDVLCETIEKDGKGMYGEIIKYCPSFFKLLCDILTDKRTGWHTKLVIGSALGYFVVPHDVIPEDEHGKIGYVDDVFVCSYVLTEVKNKVSEELLIDHWQEEEDILELVDHVFSKSKKIIGNKYQEILRFIGLRKANFNLPTLSVKRKGKEIADVDKLIHEREDLLGLLAYVTKMVYNQPPSKKVERLKEFIKSQDQYGEVEEILSMLKERKSKK